MHEENGYEMEKLFILIKSKFEYSNFLYFISFLFISTVILNEGSVYKLKLKSVGMKDAGDIAFQCGDLKDSCKITVKECMCILFFDVIKYENFYR